ncbi:class F sortase [Streptomyces sp. NPDC006552]|uniref:class F sortase n=1 Tax=Streptomyces sp. NPDC006552 TaxID=3157179 RepID=UPI0033BC35BE
MDKTVLAGEDHGLGPVSRSGRAVSYDLGSLKHGMRIDAPRRDGVSAHVTVDAINVYDATDHPHGKVYADTGHPDLRLITRGGGCEHRRGQYNGNVVISARITGADDGS